METKQEKTGHSEDRIAKAAVVIEAPVDKVWNGLVSPAVVQQYMAGAKVVSDWKEGSPIVWKGEWRMTHVATRQRCGVRARWNRAEERANLSGDGLPHEKTRQARWRHSRLRCVTSARPILSPAPRAAWTLNGDVIWDVCGGGSRRMDG
jgi:hypothetical protein